MRAVPLVAGALALAYVFVVPILERIVPRRVLVAYWHLVNPAWSRVAGRAHGFGVIETIGRKTGRRHQVPVGGRLRGDTFWFVAANGRACHYILNIEADPRVRVQVHGEWRGGRALLMPDDEARRRLLRLNPLNSVFVAIAGRDPLTVRVDLEPVASSSVT